MTKINLLWNNNLDTLFFKIDEINNIYIVNQEKEKQGTCYCEIYQFCKNNKMEDKVKYIDEQQLYGLKETKESVLLVFIPRLDNKMYLDNLIKMNKENEKINYILPMLTSSMMIKEVKKWFFEDKFDVLNFPLKVRIKNCSRDFILLTSFEDTLKNILPSDVYCKKEILLTLKGNENIKILPSLSLFDFEPNQLYLTLFTNITQMNKDKFEIIDFGQRHVEYQDACYNFINSNDKVFYNPHVLFRLKDEEKGKGCSCKQ